MAYKRVTMQDIADACGLSRNTVSKIFNDRGAVPEATRALVFRKAQELGYLQAAGAALVHAAAPVPPDVPLPQGILNPPGGPASSNAPTPPDAAGKSIALLACHLPTEYHFCTVFVPAFAERLSAMGYTLMVYKITPEELKQRVLPGAMSPEQTAGILAIELFDREYMDMVCSLGIPTIFVDAYAGAWGALLKCDFLSMENIAATMTITDHVIAEGAKRLGFMGDITHCNSFLERWVGFNIAASRAGLEVDKGLCILDEDIQPYTDADWVYSRLKRLPALPDAFICGNDLLAIRLMTALKRMGISIPEDVMVAGFDGQPQAAVVEPALTTAYIPSAEIGRCAAELIYRRIEDGKRPFRRVYVNTVPIFRASTDRTGIKREAD